MKRLERLVLVTVLALAAGRLPAAAANSPSVEQSVVVSALKDELGRSRQRLSLPGALKPYYIAYSISDRESLELAASFGAIVTREHHRDRFLNVDLRVGDHAFDNSNFVAQSGMGFSVKWGNSVAFEDDYDAVRRELWLATDAAYKEAVETLEKKRAARKNQTESPDRIGDFSQETPARLLDEPAKAALDAASYEALIKNLSALFREFPEIQASRVSLMALTSRRYFASTEGGLAVVPRTFLRLAVTCATQADDGMKLNHFTSFAVPLAAGLPNEAALKAEVRRVATELTRMRKAPVVDNYTGPVLFEGRAAAQVVRELLAENLSGTPPPGFEQERLGRMMSRENELASQSGRKILPDRFRVEDDPTLERVGGTPLIGRYALDEEGVLAQKVLLVEGGVLKGFVMSRTPRKGFPRSNGHGRAGLSGDPRGRIGNLIVSSDSRVSDAELRKRLLAEVRKAGLDYGIIVRLLDEAAITGGDDAAPRRFMLGGADGRDLPPPLVAVKLTLAGKEQLVRGVTLGSIPLSALKQIVAAGQTPTVYNYLAGGGMSGFPAFFAFAFLGEIQTALAIPTSVVGPALLFKEVTLRKPTEPQQRLPLLPHPAFAPEKK